MDVKDGIIGFAIGDALGVPVEFLTRAKLAINPIVNMIGNGTYKQPVGTWSDDTSMTIATMDSIIEMQSINYNKIMDNFCLLFDGKKYTPHGRLFDIGITTCDALMRYKQDDVDVTKAGGTNFYDNGNGSLMRILPFAYYFHVNPISDEEMATIINNISSLTHGHQISCLGCFLYVKLAMALLDGKDFQEAYNSLQKLNLKMYNEEAVKAYNKILSGQIGRTEKISDIKSTGFVVDSLEAVIFCCLNTDNYKDATLMAVNLGDDTDTIGALTGGLAGIRYGYESIPQEWLDVLAKRNYLEHLSDEYQKTIEKMKDNKRQLILK